MADNITLNSGSGGSVVASDDIGGVHFQRVKLALGADGSATDAPIGGGVESGSLRVTIASDSTGVLSVDDNGSTLSIDDGGGSITVDGTVAVSGTVTVGSHAVTNAGTFAVQVDGAALTSLQLIDDVVATDDAAFTVATSKGIPLMAVATTDQVDSGDAGALRMTTYRGLHTVAVDATGNAITPQVDDAAFTAATSLISVIGGIVTSDSVDSGDAGAIAMTADRKMHVTLKTDTVGGTSVYRSLDLDETEEDVKTSAGTLYWIHAVNVTTAVIYLKFYNATAANVTVGTTTPVLTFPVVSQGTTGGAGFVFSVPQGIAFGTAICMAATTGVADNDTGAPAANALIVNVGYA